MPVDRTTPTTSEATGAGRRAPLGDMSNTPPARKSASKKPTPTQRAAVAEQLVGELTGETLALQDELAQTKRQLREAHAATRAAEERAQASAPQDTPDLIPKPRGRITNLCHLMELSDDKDMYNYLMKEVRYIALSKFDRTKTYEHQDPFDMAKFNKAVRAKGGLEYLRRFEGNWAARELAKGSLKSDRAANKSGQAAQASHRGRASSQSSSRASPDGPGSAAEE